MAASQAKGKHILSSNDDVRVDKMELTELVKVPEISRDIGIIARKNYYYDNPEIINYAGGCFENMEIVVIKTVILRTIRLLIFKKKLFLDVLTFN